MNFSEPVVAAMIGATATVVTALVQLRLAARKQAAERAAGRPVTKGNRWLAILGLMLASAVGGYAFSEYQTFSEREDNKMLRDEMHSRLKDIGALAARLERAGMPANNTAGADIQLVAERKRGTEGVAAVINLPVCRGAQAGLSQSAAPCTESDAQRTTICSVVPLAAVVNDVQLFLRSDDGQQPWTEAKVQPGQDAGGAKFLDNYFERGHEADTKEICMNLASWGADKRSARILVRYLL